MHSCYTCYKNLLICLEFFIEINFIASTSKNCIENLENLQGVIKENLQECIEDALIILFLRKSVRQKILKLKLSTLKTFF